MDISVVVCTRNRAQHLPQMLESLLRLRSGNLEWELIFIDNGSSDDTRAILEDFAAGFPVPAKVIHEPQAGLSTARNTGWRAACGAIVSFTDDDCYPDHDWLLMVDQALRNQAAGYAGGRVLLFDSSDAPVTIQTSETPCHFPKNSHIESGQIIGANFACKRAVLEATGGFDNRLGAGTRLHAGEDTDFLIRASLAGFEGHYDPAMVVYHHHRRRLQTDVEKLCSGYARGRGALSMKTIIESHAKNLYFKNWYWRMRSLAQEKRFSDCINELRGALAFLMVARR